MYSIILILVIPFILEFFSAFRKSKDDPVKRFYIENERAFPEDYAGEKSKAN